MRAFHSKVFDNIDEYINYSIDQLLGKKLINEEDVVVHVGSTPILERGRTNMIKVSYV